MFDNYLGLVGTGMVGTGMVGTGMVGTGGRSTYHVSFLGGRITPNSIEVVKIPLLLKWEVRCEFD